MTQIDTSKEAVAALLDGVTEGPWHYGNDPEGSHKFSVHTADYFFVALADNCAAEEANARFIAAARSLVPSLAAERDALAARVAELEGME